MIIPIDDNTRVRGTDTCWQLEFLKIAKTGKSAGQSTWVAEKYYATLSGALSGALQREIRLHPAHGIAESIAAAERITERYSKLFDQGVEQ